MKDQATVVREFNELVNMTASELKKWLTSADSQSAGWPKDGEKEDGESVGHDSGRKIIEILESNPEKNPDSYSEDHIDHMRKVVAYCKRHLAKEEKTLSTKSTEEAKETKSYASLKNWGHDPLKREKKDDDSKAEKDESDKQAGDKRKAPESKAESNKKSKTEKDENNDDHKNGDTEDKDTKNGEERDAKSSEEATSKKDSSTTDDDAKQETNGHANGKNSSEDENGQDKDANGKAENGPEPGETVSWNWGNGQPEGKVEEVKPEKTSITTKNGNEASRKGDAEDPAVVIDTGKSKVIKQAHELN
ncbi:hypothetical protein L249_3723 [Ophiocordyceps polyrhachis-furcata BCC 54312]|uniref:Hypervirulence associated protein TUDOR domain-containing protein n=1 Tax=Ophiocordyceps polyrhachis-furcata BCC 54312 TaxID=1330021 RepID=A0A367L4M6_9HYPO|nr:hypothetical protein L249_3723 [Ophiocordyceps polyrhachis-furcata BCC 54312]